MVRKLIEFCIRRPVTVTIMLAVVAVLGAISFSNLKIALTPDMELPVAVVITTYTGVGPEEIEANITKTVENIVKSVNEIDTIFSYSLMGTSMVAMQFDWDTDMDQRMNDVRDKISQIEAYLPEGADKPIVMKMDINSMPVITVTLDSETLSLNQLQQMAEDEIKPYLERISDLSDIIISGGLEREIHVEIDPIKLQNYGLSLSAISSTLAAENFNQSAGNLDQGTRTLYVRSLHEFETLDDIRNVVIATSTGSIRLSDIATVSDTTEEQATLARVNGANAVAISCQKASGANTAEACEEVKQVIAEVIADLNADVEVNYINDQSVMINSTVDDTTGKIGEGAIFAVIVVLLFLKTIRSTLVICLSIPISIVSTFILMYFNGDSLNLITMGALSLGLGRMVDDSIVVYENIHRHKELGKDAVTAAIEGASEVGGAVLATTTTISASFAPILFSSGIASIMFKPMAATMICAMVASLVVSLTIVPLLASRLLDEKPKRGMMERLTGENRRRGPVRLLTDKFGEIIDRMSHAYRRTLDKALKNRGKVIAIVMAAFFGSFALVPLIGLEFVPEMDSSMISISVETDTGSSLEHTDAVLAKMETLIQPIPEVKMMAATVGVGSYISGDATDTATLYIELVGLDERERSVFEIAEEIRNSMAQNIAGAKITVNVSSSMGGGAGSTSGVQVDINGDDLDTLREISEQVEAIVASIPGTREISNSLSDGDPELQVSIDRQRAAAYGLNAYTIAGELQAALNGRTVTQYRVEGDEYNIIVSYPQDDEKDMSYLENLNLRGATGLSVPLSQVATMELEEGPASIMRYDSIRRVSVSAQLFERDLGSVSDEIQAELDQLHLPSGYSVEMGGSMEQMMESFVSLGYAMLVGLFLVYSVMAIQYESFFDPFIIMFSIPTSVIGALLGLFITGRSISVTAMVGMIMLIGTVIANAILLVEYTKQLKEIGMSTHDALVEAGGTRLRPILMTALSTALAMLPMAIGAGEGGEMMGPLGTVVIGGLFVSTFLTLYFVPTIYSVCDGLRDRAMGHNKSDVKMEEIPEA